MNGANFLINKDGKEQKLGFFQTIFVESPDPEQAELDAVGIIRNSDLREIVLNTKDDPPMIYLEELEEIEAFDESESLIQGRAFYVEEHATD